MTEASDAYEHPVIVAVVGAYQRENTAEKCVAEQHNVVEHTDSEHQLIAGMIEEYRPPKP